MFGIFAPWTTGGDPHAIRDGGDAPILAAGVAVLAGLFLITAAATARRRPLPALWALVIPVPVGAVFLFAFIVGASGARNASIATSAAWGLSVMAWSFAAGVVGFVAAVMLDTRTRSLPRHDSIG